MHNPRFVSEFFHREIFQFVWIKNYHDSFYPILCRNQMDQGLLVKMKTAQGRDIMDEINEQLFPGCV